MTDTVTAAITYVILCGVAICGLTAMEKAFSNKPATAKNRVPTLETYASQAQDSANQAQNSAKQAQTYLVETQKAQQDIKAAVEQLNGLQQNGDLKEGRPEATKQGVVLSFFANEVGISQDDVYMGFDFVEHQDGFTKKFFPVCDGQSVPGNKPIILMYHWRHWQFDGSGKRGCYVIDGYREE
jgi:hypothetical protein